MSVSRKNTTDTGKNAAAVKKTPAQREKEEKENRLSALGGIVREKIRDKENLDFAADQIVLPDLAGKGVVHRKFGEGEILSCEGRVFRVSFKSGKNIRMQFPDAFDKGILEAGSEEDREMFEKICEQFRLIDSQKELVDKRIYEISAEMSRINF